MHTVRNSPIIGLGIAGCFVPYLSLLKHSAQDASTGSVPHFGSEIVFWHHHAVHLAHQLESGQKTLLYSGNYMCVQCAGNTFISAKSCRRIGVAIEGLPRRKI